MMIFTISLMTTMNVEKRNMKKCNYSVSLRVLCDTGKHTCITQKFRYSRMPRHSCCEVRVMQLHDILLLRTSASLHSVSVGAKPLSTGQCAPCRRLYQLGAALVAARPSPLRLGQAGQGGNISPTHGGLQGEAVYKGIWFRMTTPVQLVRIGAEFI